MSNFGAPTSFEEAQEMERQMQEEYRRRQTLQQAGHSAALTALARARQQQDYAASAATQQHLAILESPYGYGRPPPGGPHAQQHHGGLVTSSAARLPTSIGLLDARATADYVVQQQQRLIAQEFFPQQQRPYGEHPQLAQLYAAQQQQHRQQQAQAVQQAVAANYSAAYGPYGGGPPQNAAAAALEQQQRYAAAYGLPPPAPAPVQYQQADSYGSDAAAAVVGLSLQQAASAYRPKPPPPSAPAAYAQQQQQQQQQQQKSPAAAVATTPTSASAASNKTSSSKPKAKPPSTPSSASALRTPKGRSPKSTKHLSGTSSTTAAANAAASGTTTIISKNGHRIEVPLPTPRVATKDGKIIVGGKATYYTGWLPLGLEDDKYWLSELQVYLRSEFAEAFGATEEDIAAPMHGRNKPIALGQVGIRCKHCKHDNPAERGQQATSYPSLISGIYNSVQQMLRLHLDCCLSMPPEVRAKIEALKISCSSRGGRKQYWVDSARRLGLVDTPHGIHFGRDPYGPLPPLTGPSVNSKEGRRKRMLKATAEAMATKAEEHKEEEPPPPVDDRPLVFDEDRSLISDYLYLTLEQMAPCLLMEADRVGCYKTRKVGFPGLACKHCVGQAGCGRYFPASEASLSQTTTSQTIMNHVRNCRRCPNEIRENLEIMKRNRMGPDGKRADKPKHGGRKVFFHRLWCRIQGLQIQEELDSPKEPRRRKSRNGSKKSGTRKKKVAAIGSDNELESEEDVAGDLSSGDEETESEMESDVPISEDEEEARAKKRRATPTKTKPYKTPWFEGCVRLTKTDDPHWLSEMECFARSDLLEVFSLDKNPSSLDGYSGRKEPAVGQVGIRCIFCKSLEPAERPTGCVSFPDTVSSVHVKVTDMIRLHFPGCPSLPDDARETFKSLRGFDAKVANDDSQQYWADTARDIGLANVPPAGTGKAGAWGITFRRDPLQPSPADELDLENTNGSGSESFGNDSLVRASDRGLCTDQVMLLLRQVQPCRFKKSDRRAGPGYRGRDRSMGFPGLTCKHCAGQNTLGRYFPVSAKNLTDATSNSLQTHVVSCAYCPEPIRASIAYLGHRSILQKAELRGCWKKAFFKMVWDRLHVERKWKSIDDEEGSGSEEDMAAAAEIMEEEPADDETKQDDAESDSEKEAEELGDSMNALIKAAAIWLTEQDAATDTARAAARTTKGRSLPAKRPAVANGDAKPSRSVRGDTTLPTNKRRRVHF